MSTMVFEDISVIFPSDKECFFLEQLINIRKKYYVKVTESFSIVKDILLSNNYTVCYRFQLIFLSQKKYNDYLSNPETITLSRELNSFCAPLVEKKRVYEICENS